MRPGDTAASRALERGKRFLLANQGGDGLWRDFLTPAGEASEWPTGFVATALHLAGAETSALERAADALVARQHEDGGWGYNVNVPSDADSTAWVLLFLARMGAPRRGRAAARLRCLVAAPADGERRHRDLRRARSDPPLHGRRQMDAIQRLVQPAHRGDGDRRSRARRPLAERIRRPAPPGGTSGRGSVPTAAGARTGGRRPHYATLQAVELALASGGDVDAGRPRSRVGGCEARPTRRWGAPGAETSAFATALSLSILLLRGASGDRSSVRSRHSSRFRRTTAAGPAIRSCGSRSRERSTPTGGGRCGSAAASSSRDQHRTFTSAACVAALARAADN